MNTKAVQRYEASLQQTVDRFGSLFAKDSQQEELAKLHKMIGLGFDPRLGHMCVYEKRLWLCHVGAMWWKNQQDPDRRFGIVHRIIPKDMRESYGLVNGDIGVIAQVLDYRNGGVVIAEGFGKANPEKPYRNNPIETNNPFIMAQKRSEGQAIKRGFPLGVEMPTMADEDRQIINGESRVVEETTGEIKEPTPAPPAQTQPPSSPNPDLDICPLHGVDWRKGSYGRFHKCEDGSNCNLKKALAPKLEKLWGFVGEGSCMEWLKKKHDGQTWSQLTDEVVVNILNELQSKADAKEAQEDGGEIPFDPNQD